MLNRSPRVAAFFWRRIEGRFCLWALSIGGRAACVLLLATLAAARSAAAVQSGPLGIVRQFCRADAFGRRASMRGWPDEMPIVSWPFEPAWDFAILITGYEVGSPRPSEAGALEVDVHYTVVGQVSALGFDANAYVEAVPFRLHASEGRWRIIGPPPPPHIFVTRADIELMRRSFEFGTANFLPNSLCVWEMLRAAGWNVPFQRTTDLLMGTTYRPVEKPQVGDLVVHLRDEVPYHVGLLEAENQVVSSTLNAGIVHTTVDAFPGEVRYLRLIEPEPGALRRRPATTPAVAKATKKPTPRAQRHAQPSARPCVEATVAPPAPSRRPVAPSMSP
jgi:hypothetical protein